MSGPVVAPYGTWRSRISASLAARSSVRLSEPWVEGEVVYWLERRPEEAGRCVVVRSDPWSEPIDLLPPGFSARDKVHEYGGGSYTVHEGRVFFTNFEDQRLYRLDPGAVPVPITPPSWRAGADRHADLRVSPDGRSVVCVRERHTPDGPVVNEVAMVPTDGSDEPWVVGAGRDFYACPRFASDGSCLAWIEWDMPRMPWDGTELMVAGLGGDARASDLRRVAGGPRESIFQPEWGPDGLLHFVSDRTGWWNLYREEPDGSHTGLAPMAAEFGVPLWELGYTTYAFLGDGRIVCVYRRAGSHHLAMLDPATSELVDLDVAQTVFDHSSVRTDGNRIAFIGASPTESHQVVTLDFGTRAAQVLRRADEVDLDPGVLSVPETIEFPTAEGTAFAYHYPPVNAGFVGPADERPPMLVMSHGGPTAESVPALDLHVQFFTSRGFALVDVNYGGSTGYGREYRERLYGRWGEVDVADCIAAARYLVERGDADGDRLIVAGGSAGGWTTLCALAFHDVFACGASYYGVADLEPFVETTHKFEARYLDQLVGPWPEAADVYRARSPARAADRISCPVLLLQGLEDEVVPPSQAEAMLAALDANRIPHAYLAFEGEQHGFRKAENIARSLEAELTFYGRVLGFEPADDLPPLPIRHLPS